MSRSACIVPEQLEWLLNGQLVGPELEGITAHVQNCEACQQVLERLTRVPVPEGVGGPDRDGPTGDASFFERLKAQVPVPSDKARPESDNPTLEVPFPPADGQGPLSPPEHVDPSVEPGTIGRYRIIRRLGRGGFGWVYLAQDESLDRPVAVKVPSAERPSLRGNVEAFLTEARVLARLDHPHIVPVYDYGRTDDGLCFVVSKYVEGSSLADRLRHARLTFQDSAELTASVAEALHHAHIQGLVHRDVKPANILIDVQGRPHVADFGLALTDEDFGKGVGFIGTPAYMSPEQARGEGHLVNGRSDIFSLGVVLYELLTGRRPFRAESPAELMERIATTEPRPPRQVNDAIPRELERICRKALAKRASERYSTSRDMADDLRHFLRAEAASDEWTTALECSAAPSESARELPPSPRTPGGSDSAGRAVNVVPKGLRSFDRHDADFYLELLPGPRDRDGLPESLRFWKTRIDATDPDATFRVGLIYGPSGCGKSSLVNAGLLPRLGRHVEAVYTEATPMGTEARLLRGLQKACPELPAGQSLVQALTALRRGRVLRPGQKVLLLLDQFEQWLFTRRAAGDTALVDALRQCDGEHVQAVVLVRDDFWMAATRFMRDLDIRLVEGQNSAAVDLFDTFHARGVLAAFGRAYKVLPERASELTPEQRAFLEQSVEGLAQDGKVVPIRLALFAEMVKGRPWTPASLRDVGGPEGVGVTFLDGTFSAPTAPPEHRLHQKAAQAVLKALLPPAGTDIKGRTRPAMELRDASGYVGQPDDFDALIRILDLELRLITPTDPEVSDAGDQAAEPEGHGHYQLTHDYLVRPLREWLTRKQRETPRGRAELRLAERSAIWDAKPETRHLPSLWEWANIRLLTRRRDWTEPQRRMMRRAGRAYLRRTLALAAVVAVLAAAGMTLRDRINEDREAAMASGLVQQLFKAETAEVPGIIRAIGGHRRRTDPELRRALVNPAAGPKEMLHASLALLPIDPAQVPYLEARLLRASARDLPVVRAALEPFRSRLVNPLWTTLESSEPGDERLAAGGRRAGPLRAPEPALGRSE